MHCILHVDVCPVRCRELAAHLLLFGQARSKPGARLQERLQGLGGLRRQRCGEVQCRGFSTIKTVLSNLVSTLHRRDCRCRECTCASHSTRYSRLAQGIPALKSCSTAC